MVTTRKQQRETTCLRVVEGSEALFGKNGISNTTTAEIARTLDISHGTLFIHFPTRDDLILAVVDRFGERLSTELKRKLSPVMPLVDQLRIHMSVLSEFEDFYLRTICEFQILPTKIRTHLTAINIELSHRFYQAAKAQMASGQLKKMSQASFFNTWMSLLTYLILNRDLFCEKTPILKHKREEILRHFVHLVGTQEKP